MNVVNPGPEIQYTPASFLSSRIIISPWWRSMSLSDRRSLNIRIRFSLVTLFFPVRNSCTALADMGSFEDLIFKILSAILPRNASYDRFVILSCLSRSFPTNSRMNCFATMLSHDSNCVKISVGMTRTVFINKIGVAGPFYQEVRKVRLIPF